MSTVDPEALWAGPFFCLTCTRQLQPSRDASSHAVDSTVPLADRCYRDPSWRRHTPPIAQGAIMRTIHMPANQTAEILHAYETHFGLCPASHLPPWCPALSALSARPFSGPQVLLPTRLHQSGA